MQCPGQDSRYWDGQAVFEAPCPKCGKIVEFFKDDSTRKCSSCGHKMLNPRTDFGCAAYCPYAEQCLGAMPPELLAKQQELLKERVAIEMKKVFTGDFAAIGRASKTARYAEQIGEHLEANPAVTVIASYLAGLPEQARELLDKLAAPAGLRDEVCEIIARLHSPGSEESANYQTVRDAVTLADLDEKGDNQPCCPLLTEKGRELANKQTTP